MSCEKSRFHGRLVLDWENCDCFLIVRVLALCVFVWTSRGVEHGPFVYLPPLVQVAERDPTLDRVSLLPPPSNSMHGSQGFSLIWPRVPLALRS